MFSTSETVEQALESSRALQESLASRFPFLENEGLFNGLCLLALRAVIDAELRSYKHPRRSPSVRSLRIQELWLAGYSLNQIAGELRSTKNAVGVSMVEMRKAGWNLPYRHKGYPR